MNQLTTRTTAVFATAMIAMIILGFAAVMTVSAQTEPERPTDLTAIAIDHDTVSLTWSHPDPASVDHYQVLSRTVGASTGLSQVGTSTTTSFEHDGLEPESTYRYRVKPVNSEGEEGQRSARAEATTPAEETPAPEPDPTPVPDPTPAQPQRSDDEGQGNIARSSHNVLVTNSGETVNLTSASSAFLAQRFTTGPNASGYTIAEVGVFISNIGPTTTTVVSIRENDSSNTPGDLVATLTNPATFSNDALNMFTAPSNTTIDGVSTHYWITVNDGLTSNRGNFRGTTGDGQTGETGWSIGNARLWRSSESSAWNTDSVNLVISVRGSARTSTASDDATLSDLELEDDSGTAITLSPSFVSGTTTYTAPVVNSVDEITITPTVNESNASYEIQDNAGTPLTDADTNTTGFQVDLSEGANIINVEVTAEDASTETYTVTVTRTPADCETDDIWCATLTVGTHTTGGLTFYGYSVGLGDTTGTLSPNTFTYRAATIGVLALKYDSGATGTLRWGISLLSGTTPTDGVLGDDDFTLHVGTHTFAIDAPGTTTTFTFPDHGLSWTVGDTVTVRLVKNPSSDVTLTDLELEGAGGETITLSPEFAQGTTAYTAAVANRIDTVTLSATKNDANATVVITSDDDNATPGEAELDLSVGANALTITVTAEDASALAYTITATRATAPPAPTDCPTDTDWCATLVLGYIPISSAQFTTEQFGYFSDSNFGDLSSATFSHGGISYTVSTIFRVKATRVSDSVVQTDNITFTVSPELPDGVVLQLDTRTFTVDADSEGTSTGQEQWDTKADPPVWTAGQHVTVSLKLPSETLLVSNLDVDGEGNDTTARIAQRFNTGENPGGYTLTTVEVSYADSQGDTFAAMVCTVVGADQPTSTCTELTPPSTFTAGLITFTAPAATELTASTKYTLVLTPETGKTLTYNATAYDAEDSDSLPNWNIAGEYRYESGNTWEQQPQSEALQFRLKGQLVTTTLPELSFQSINISVDEDGSQAGLAVELSQTSADTVTVDYATSDITAEAGDDYTATSGTLTFAAGETVMAIIVPILDDAIYEPTERFDVTLSNPTGATLPTFPGARVIIAEDESPPTATIANVTVGEGAGTLTLTLTLSHESSKPTVYLATTSGVGGTATQGADYENFLSGGEARITVPAGDTQASLDITITDDAAAESSETITIRWDNDPSSGKGDATPSIINFTGAITDNDSTDSSDATLSALAFRDNAENRTLTPGFTPGTYAYAAQVVNAATTATLTATPNHSEAEVTNVTLAGTAIADTNLTDGITVPSLVVGDNVIVVTVTAQDNTTQDYTVTITRAPALPAVNIVPSNWSLKPAGLSAGEFRLIFLSSTKHNAESSNIGTYNTFVQNRAAAGHADIRDYSSAFKVVGCTADVDARDNTGTTHTSADRGVPIYWLNGTKVADNYQDFYNGTWDDEANDRNESGNDAHDTSQSANYPWTGCDHNGTESISGNSLALGKNAVRTGEPNSSLGTRGPLQGAGSSTSDSPRPFYGLSSVFQVEPSNYPNLSIIDASATEGDDIVFTVNLSGTSADDVTFDYATSRKSDDNSEANDFTATSGTGTITAGSTYTTITIPTHDDGLNDASSRYEGDETFTVTISNPTLAGISQATAKGTILDDERLPTVKFTSSDRLTTEDAGHITNFLTFDVVPPGEHTAYISFTLSGTATAGQDYNIQNTTLTVNANINSITTNIIMVNDNVAELDETAIITVVAASANIQVDPEFSTRTLTIQDNDEHPTLSFTSETYNVNENDGHAVLTVNKTGDSSFPLRVDYETVSRNLAIAGDDYVATSGTLTFQPAEFSKTISVPIIDNNIYRDFGQRFNVELNYSPQSSGETDPVLGTRTAVVIIINDDPVPTASMANVTANERAGTMTLTLKLSHPSSQDISYRTPDNSEYRGGTATFEVDYEIQYDGSNPARITVPAGQLTRSFDITLIDDNLEEPDETVELVWLKVSSSQATPDEFTFTGTITDPPICDALGNLENTIVVMNLTGEITQPDQSKFHRIRLDPYRSYMIEAIGRVGEDMLGVEEHPNLTLSNPDIPAIWNARATSKWITYGDRNDGDQAKNVIRRFLDSDYRTYKVEVNAGNNGTGTYQLKIRVNNICRLDENDNAHYQWAGGPLGYPKGSDLPAGTGGRQILLTGTDWGNNNVTRPEMHHVLGDNWNSDRDEDWIGVDLEQGGIYTVRLRTKNNLPERLQATGLKILGIYDSNGNAISGTASTGAAGKKVFVTDWTAPSTGRFHIAVGSVGNDRTGMYWLSIIKDATN